MIPAFVCKEYPYSKACVDEFKHARKAGKLLVIALAPVWELEKLEIEKAKAAAKAEAEVHPTPLLQRKVVCHSAVLVILET